jgi:hypothetical protein
MTYMREVRRCFGQDGNEDAEPYDACKTQHPSSSAERGGATSKAGDPAQESSQTQYCAFGNFYAGSPNGLHARRSRMTKYNFARNPSRQSALHARRSTKF